MESCSGPVRDLHGVDRNVRNPSKAVGKLAWANDNSWPVPPLPSMGAVATKSDIARLVKSGLLHVKQKPNARERHSAKPHKRGGPRLRTLTGSRTASNSQRLRTVAAMIRRGDTISQIADALHVSRKIVAEWIQVQPLLAAAVRHAKDMRELLARERLYERAMRGDLRAMQLYLATEPC